MGFALIEKKKRDNRYVFQVGCCLWTAKYAQNLIKRQNNLGALQMLWCHVKQPTPFLCSIESAPSPFLSSSSQPPIPINQIEKF